MGVTRHTRAIELAFASFFLASIALVGSAPAPAAARVDGAIAPRAQADFVPTIPWSAEYTETLQHSTSDDVVPDEVRAFNPSWQFTLFPFYGAMPGSVTVATPLYTSNWFVSPAVTPTTSAGIATYRWETPAGVGGVNAYLSSLGRFPGVERFSLPTSLGASIARESIGGKRIDAGATVSRSYVFTAVGSSDLTLDISVYLDSAFGGPVVPSNQQCEGARVLGGGGFAWSASLSQGSPVTLRCSAMLTNTAPTPAYYMPMVFATRTERTSTAPENGRVQYAFTSPLGSVAFDVVPGPDVNPQGRLTKTSTRTVLMFPTNQALVPTQLTYLRASSGYYGEGATLSARLNHHTTFAVVQRPVRFEVDGATYTATTGADGIATVNIPAGLGAVGPHLVTVSSTDDQFFLGTSLTTTFTVLRRPTTTAFTGTTSALYGEARVAGTAADSRTGTPLAGQTLSFSIDGAPMGSAVTDQAGTAELPAPSSLGAGTHEVTVSFAQNATHDASTATAHITIVGRPTLTTYTGDASAIFGFATLAGRVSDERSGAPLAGQTLTFAIDGAFFGAATTDASGTATIASVAILPGGHDIEVSFAGDASHGASSASGRIAIVNSLGKVTGDVRTADGTQVSFSVRSDLRTVSGALQLNSATYAFAISITAAGISTDQTKAVIYGETASGDRIVAELADLGEPGRTDRVIVRINGATITGDGALIEGNVQIHK